MKLIDKIKWRISYMIDFRRMNTMTELQELIDYAKERNETYFLEHIEQWKDYMNRPRISRPQHYVSLFDYLKLDLSNKDALELGPGWGAFLQVARDSGARIIDFIDYNPYVYTYNRLNEFHGIINDYYKNNAFKAVNSKYDLIVSRGSISVDRFERQFNGSRFRLISFPKWLKRLEDLCNLGGTIIISPTYDIGDDKENPYLCHREKTINTKFYSHMWSAGYDLLPYVENWTDEKFFPFTFIKRMGE